MIACNSGYYEVVNMLLIHNNNNKDMICQTNKDGATALHLAARTGCIKCITIIMEYDSQNKMLGMMTRNGKSVLHYAVRGGDYECVQFFVIFNGGELLHVADKGGMLPAHEACGVGICLKIVQLVTLSTELMASDCAGLNVLHHGAFGGNVDIVRWLLNEMQMEIAIENKSEKGMTAIALAMMHGYIDIVLLLMENGAIVKNEWIQRCQQLGFHQCVQVINEFRRTFR